LSIYIAYGRPSDDILVLIYVLLLEKSFNEIGEFGAVIDSLDGWRAIWRVLEVIVYGGYI
jgi:hypothetical protein